MQIKECIEDTLSLLSLLFAVFRLIGLAFGGRHPRILLAAASVFFTLSAILLSRLGCLRGQLVVIET